MSRPFHLLPGRIFRVSPITDSHKWAVYVWVCGKTERFEVSRSLLELMIGHSDLSVPGVEGRRLPND